MVLPLNTDREVKNVRQACCAQDHLTFDTFGFSRDAAAARHFSNEVALGQNGPLGNISKIFRGAFHQAYNVEYQHDVQMGFIGLFDTVPSAGGLPNLGYVRSQTQPGSNCICLAACFPMLSN